MKVLHLPSSVGGQASGLAHGERAIGIDSRVLYLYDNYIHYPADYTYHLERRGKIGRLAGHASAFLRFRTGFDVYHFNYGSSLIHFLNRGVRLWDLPFYDRSARKIFTFNGCDARQKYPTMQRNRSKNAPAACFMPNCYGGMCNSGSLDRQRRLAIDKAAEYAHHMFAVNPDLLYFLPAEKSSFLPYAVAGFDDIAPKTEPFCPKRRIRVVHAPTQREAKGSGLILRALDDLKSEFGDRLEVCVVEGLSHADALATYRTADLFIDQVLIGWYGGVAVEVMKMGIPVACFINDDHLAMIDPAMARGLPILRVNPFQLVEQLRPLLQEPEQLAEHGVRARTWVEHWHAPTRIARITAAAYLGNS